jgi:exosortase
MLSPRAAGYERFLFEHLNAIPITIGAMALETTRTMVESPAEKPGLMDEWREFSASIPNKGLFAILFGAWVALFHFYGNSTLGYGGLTPSVFSWLRLIYGNDVDEGLGVYVPVVVLALVWWKRRELIQLDKRVWWPALGGFGLAILLHVVGYVIQQTRVSLLAFAFGIYCLTGLVWGRDWMKATFFPVFLLVFAIPMGTHVEQFTLPLREFATRITVVASRLLGINVVQEGTLMFDTAQRYQYNVEAACSGLRSLTTMLALACVFGFTSFQEIWKRGILIISAIPFAILGNVLRLLTIVIAAEAAGQEAGNYVHKHWLFSLIPYFPAMVGMSLMAKWLRRGQKKAVTA